MPNLRQLERIGAIGAHLGIGAALTLWHARADEARRAPVIRDWHAGVCRRLRVTVSHEGAPLASGALWVVNHVSWLDIPVIGSLSTQAVFLAKSDVRGWPLIGWLTERAGSLFIARGAGAVERVQEDIARRLERGQSVVLFAEGTTTDGRDVRRFHPRLFQAALQAGAPVQPLALSYPVAGQAGMHPAVPYVGEDSFGRSLARIAAADEVRAHLHAFDPLPPVSGRDALARASHALIRSAILGAVDRASAPLSEPARAA
ncbi:MAG: lysophospholipid acyltransferase family protein [Halothiobacillaceae bacterium]|jgi:1-acyl-sn-glycerol-3-phosphate acyltransferase|nr:lysophospholipid acyltransferase family protein [Halothiobacillaceae bacterium]MDY0049364.1 lysophospholipid acyltransferase family protein [Halothiobacillaceae bacterium]